MIISLFDQSREKEQSAYGEAVRLSNELRPKPEQIIDNGLGYSYTIPARWGFDCETAPYSDFTTWLGSNIKKSQSLFWFVIRVMAWRFPEKHNEIKDNLSERRKLEFDIILSQMKKEIEWVGTVGYQNMVELNPNSNLNNKNIKVVKKPNDRFIIKRK